MKKIIFLLALVFLLAPSLASARLGVGVGTGKIVVEDELKPGTIYTLPSLTVLNTGDEEADYEAAITYHQDQPELEPPEEWFSFSPQKFFLEPGQAQEVKIKLNLPVRAQPGEYFAYLEGHPLKKAEKGQTSIGVAAAAKLYFTVVPANLVLGVYYRALSFWQTYSPWTQRGAILLGLIILWSLLRRRFKIQVVSQKPPAKGKKEPVESANEE